MRLSISPSSNSQPSRRSALFGLPALGVALGLLLMGGGSCIAAEPAFAGTELRDSFPAQGDEGIQPELLGGWGYFAEKDGAQLVEHPFVWTSHNTEVWPEGRLTAGSAYIQPDALYDDALTVVPGNHESNAVLQWTAPADGNFNLDGWFQKLQKTPTLAQETEGVELIIRGPSGNELQKFTAGIEDTEVKTFSIKLPNMKAGETVAFVVRGITVNWGNETRLSARITK